MTTHELKTWPEPFAAVWEGLKRYEVRKDDRGFAVGHCLRLREWMPDEGRYSGREFPCMVTYMSRGPDWGLPVGFVVMSIAKIVGPT